MTFTCVIVDDNEPFLEGARRFLDREGVTVAGVATTSAEALLRIETLQPDVVLVDFFLGEESGPELARRLVEECAATVILISSHSASDLDGVIAANPAAGFLTKTDLSADAIQRIVEGHQTSRV